MMYNVLLLHRVLGLPQYAGTTIPEDRAASVLRAERGQYDPRQ
jgi:hypothetical protein